MAHSLPSSGPTVSPPAGSPIHEAVLRLESTFLRLEQAASAARARHHSLKQDHEKLNHLLRDADRQIATLREAAYTVCQRLDRTIGLLEREDDA